MATSPRRRSRRSAALATAERTVTVGFSPMRRRCQAWPPRPRRQSRITSRCVRRTVQLPLLETEVAAGPQGRDSLAASSRVESRLSVSLSLSRARSLARPNPDLLRICLCRGACRHPRRRRWSVAGVPCSRGSLSTAARAPHTCVATCALCLSVCLSVCLSGCLAVWLAGHGSVPLLALVAWCSWLSVLTVDAVCCSLYARAAEEI
jgi:hypothetical protein